MKPCRDKSIAFRFLSTITAAFLFACCSTVQSQGIPAESADPAIQAIRLQLSQRMQDVAKVDEIRPSGIPGLYEVRAGRELFYTDSRVSYLMHGELLDISTHRNLTRERLDQLNAIDFRSLPLQDAIVWRSGNGSRRIAVFADPNCPYCKKLEAELQKLSDVTVYTFLFPILAADSEPKARDIWCSPDPTQAWRGWMLNGIAASGAKPCANPVQRNLALGKSHYIDAVPALIFEDGSRSPGLLSAPQIEARWEGLKR